MKKGFVLTALFLLSLIQVWTQDKKSSFPLIGDKAHSFTAMSTNGQVNFPSDYGTSWKILFSHPRDYTPVCSSELLELAYQQSNFDKLGVKLIVVSADDLITHNTWKASLEDINFKERGPVKINFPLVADPDLKISELYEMVRVGERVGPNIRGVFIIDPANNVRAIYHYPNEVGRNIDELKRTLMALQAVDGHLHTATPANWIPGDDVMATSLSPSEIKNMGKLNSDLYQVAWFMTYRKTKK